MSDVFRKKIETVVARGGIADPDAPLDSESTRYRVSLSIEEDETWTSSTAVKTKGNLDNQDAVRIQLGNPAVGTAVASADPINLVREQLASLAAAPTPDSSRAPSTPSVAPSRASGWELVLIDFYSFFAIFCQARPKQRGSRTNLQVLPLSRTWLWQGRR